jgi:hypothetical protein
MVFEARLATSPLEGARVEVEHQVPDEDRRHRRWRGRGGRTAHAGPEPRGELDRTERLGDEVVRSGLQERRF